MRLLMWRCFESHRALFSALHDEWLVGIELRREQEWRALSHQHQILHVPEIDVRFQRKIGSC